MTLRSVKTLQACRRKHTKQFVAAYIHQKGVAVLLSQLGKEVGRTLREVQSGTDMRKLIMHNRRLRADPVLLTVVYAHLDSVDSC